MNMGRRDDVMVSGDLGRQLFETSALKLGPSGRERPRSGGVRLQIEDVFVREGSLEMERFSGWRNVTSEGWMWAEAPRWT